MGRGSWFQAKPVGLMKSSNEGYSKVVNLTCVALLRFPEKILSLFGQLQKAI